MASTYLSRTSTSATLATKYTLSFWIKIANVGTDYRIVNQYADANNTAAIYFDASNNYLNIVDKLSGSTHLDISTTRKFRDTNAWYHIVIAADTTQSTAADRLKVYINGVQETSFSPNTYPSQDASLGMQTVSASGQRRIGTHNGGNGDFLDGSLAHFHFIDGLAYPASTFGETDSTSGIWVPKTSPSVTYGNNGVFLKFENSAAMGTDSSGNSNTYTVNGTMTQNKDTPSNNFATLNPLYNPTGSPSFTHGNTTISGYDSGKFYSASTLGVNKGKWYSEYKIHATQSSATIHLGISSNPEKNSYHNYFPGEDTRSYSWGEFGSTWYNGTGTAQGTTFTTGDIVGIALDVDNSKLYFSKNGSWISIGGVTGVPTSGATGTGAISINSADANDGNGFWHFAIGDNSGTYGSDNVINCNFGQGYFGTTAIASEGTNASGIGKFEYDVPTGYTALSTKGLNE
jgi:hypothetical protein